jgi:hydroxyacylglutathione hydrolase
MEAGARVLYGTLGKIKGLPPELLVWPAHGSGSACGKALGGSPVTSIGYERRANWGLRAATEEAFVREVLSGQPEPPVYFAEMKRVNKAGPEPMPPMPEHLPSSRLAPALAEGFVVDLRPRADAEGFVIAGAVSVPLGRQFPTWAGSLFRPKDRIVLLAPDQESADRAAKYLALVGNRAHAWIQVEAAIAEAERSGLLVPAPVTPARDLPSRLGSEGDVVLDVRRASETEASAVEGTVHAPLARLAEIEAGLPAGKRFHVHCASGMRALVASSYLRAKGRDAYAVAEPYSAVCEACASAVPTG